MVKMRLFRMGDKKNPIYRVVVVDSRKAATGEYISTVRHFTDGRDTLAIVTAPTAIYADWEVPTYRARCIGVVDIYKNLVALRLSNHQITPMEE